jgi:hypothetical protein
MNVALELRNRSRYRFQSAIGEAEFQRVASLARRLIGAARQDV